jgi:hypothetical protein
MALDAGNKKFVDICLGVLDEIWRGLFSRNGDQRYTLVSWLKPDDFGTFNGTSSRLITTIAFTFAPLSLLLLLSSSRRRA